MATQKILPKSGFMAKPGLVGWVTDTIVFARGLAPGLADALAGKLDAPEYSRSSCWSLLSHFCRPSLRRRKYGRICYRSQGRS